MSTTIVSCDILHTTEEAVLLEVENNECWVPRSLIIDGDDLEKGLSQEIEIKEWFCNSQGWF